MPKTNHQFSIYALILTGITTLVLYPTIHFQFLINDDPLNVTNPYTAELSIENLRKIWVEPNEDLYTPVTTTLWMVQGHFAKNPTAFYNVGSERWRPIGLAHFPNQEFDPKIYHLTSLIFHLCSSVLVLYILNLLFGVPILAFFGSLFFAIHPIQIEAISWVSSQKDLVSGFFGLAAIAAFLKALNSENIKAHWGIFALSFFLYLMAICSKPNMVVLPFVLLALSLFQQKSNKQLVMTLATWLIPAVVISIVTSQLQSDEVVAKLMEIPQWYLRPAIALDAIGFYITKVVWPANLNFDYGRNPSAALNSTTIYVTTLSTAFASLFIWKFLRRNPQVIFGCALFLIFLLPVMGFKPFQYQHSSTVADRYMYCALLGLIIAVLGLLKSTNNKVFLAGMVFLCSALGIKSLNQMYQWQDAETLYNYSISTGQATRYSYNLLGSFYARNNEPLRGLNVFEAQAREIGDFKPLEHAGGKFLQMGMYKLSLDVANRLISMVPQESSYYVHRAMTWRALNSNAQAKQDFEKALALDPNNSKAAKLLMELEKK